MCKISTKHYVLASWYVFLKYWHYYEKSGYECSGKQIKVYQSFFPLGLCWTVLYDVEIYCY